MTITAFPLCWPPGWKRIAPVSRTVGRFGTSKTSSSGNWRRTEDISIYAATVRLRQELERMGVRDDDMVLSTSLRLRLDGLPRSDQAQPTDPGAAVYWTDPWGGAPRCMAIDRYTKVEQNLAALAATIDAMRAIERHGGAVVLERAFTGFIALAAPADTPASWRAVLELVGVSTPTREKIDLAYRRVASKHHPDRGGDASRMASINTARQQALAWLETSR